MPSTVPYIMRDIPLSDIIFPVEEMRSQVNFENLDELAKSIRQVGLLNPISVRPKGDKFELIAGFRRTKACEIAGLVAVPARVLDSDDPMADLQKAHENLFREDVNTIDEAAYIKTVMTKNNYKLQDMASLIHKSAGYVSRRLSMLEGPENVREALKDGRINLSVAEELIKVKSDDDRGRLLYLVLNNGATVDIVRSWRIQGEMHQNSNPPQTYEQNQQNPDGTAYDPSKMGGLLDDRGAQINLQETVTKTRVCHCCIKKVPEEEAKLLILCPRCAGAIQPYLSDVVKVG